MRQERFMSIRATAKLGLIGERTLRQMEAKGELPGIRIGTHFKVNVPMLIDKLDAISAANGGMQL